MFRYGRRVYYAEEGAVIAQLGLIETSSQNYYEENDPRDWHPALIEKEGIEMQQFEWGEYEEEFSTQKLARIDPRTRQPQFEDWPEPDPPEPQPESDVDVLRRQVTEQDARIGDIELGLAEIFAGGGD